MTTLEDSIRQAIEAYLARFRLSERKLGAFVTGDTAFIPRVRAGASMRLDTADRLLIYMNEEPIGPAFRSEVEAFLSETGIGERKFGSRAAGNPSFVTRLRSGATSRLSTVQRVQGWMRAHKDELIRAAAAREQAEHRETSDALSSDGEAEDTLDALAMPQSPFDDESALERTIPAEEQFEDVLHDERGRGPSSRSRSARSTAIVKPVKDLRSSGWGLPSGTCDPISWNGHGRGARIELATGSDDAVVIDRPEARWAARQAESQPEHAFMTTLDDFIRTNHQGVSRAHEHEREEIWPACVRRPRIRLQSQEGEVAESRHRRPGAPVHGRSAHWPQIPRRGRGVPLPHGHEALQARRGRLG